MLRRSDSVAKRRVHDDNALRRRRVKVDVVDADPGAADDLHIRRLLQDVGRDLGRRAHDQAVVFADTSDQLVGRHHGLDVNLDTTVEEALFRQLTHLVGYENVNHQSSLPP